MSPQEELQSLNTRVDDATELEQLRPIFERMTAISHDHPDDFEVILAVDQLRRHIVDKGKVLREQQEALEEPEDGEGVNGEGEEPAPQAEPVPDWFAGSGPPVTPPSGSPGGTTEIFPAPTPVAPATGPQVVPKPTGEFDIAPAPAPVAPVPPITPVPPIVPVVPQPPPDGAKKKKLAWIGAAAALLALAGAGAVWFVTGHKGSVPPPPTASTVPIEVATTPPGATIQVNGETKCKSNCRVELAPGAYQLTAVLEGFEAGAAPLNVVAGNPLNVSLSLVPQPGTVRIMADMEGATVMLDGKPAGNVQDGQFLLDRVAPGAHVMKVAGRGGEVEFPFEIVAGKLPEIKSPVKSGPMLTVLVASMGPSAKIYSSAPSKVSVNGQPQGQTDLKGLDLKDVPAGEQTLSLGEGQNEKPLVVSFGPAPSIAAFIKQPEVTTGTLVISTGEDDVTVSVNGKEVRRKTSRGMLRIPAVGSVSVHVAKNGFQPEPDQKVEIKKGEEKKVSFVMRPLPKVAAMQIHNAVPGTQILFDDQPLGRVGPDGSFSAANLPPGEHWFEARREGFVPKRFQRGLRAGETLTLGGADVALTVAGATVHLTVNPVDATVLYRRAEDSQFRPAVSNTLKVDPGNYVFVARAPGHVERTVSATVGAGESRNIEISLVRAEAPKPRPTLTWAGWSKEGDEFVRKGGNRVVVVSGPMVGTLTFTAQLLKGGNLFRGGRLRWFIEDGTGATQYEVDRRRFQAKGPAGQRSKDLPKDATAEDAKTYSFEIELSSDRIVHKIKSGSGWVTIDTHAAKAGADTRFGFTIPGNDEISISALRFAPR